jgi:hypothetical protein
LDGKFEEKRKEMSREHIQREMEGWVLDLGFSRTWETNLF